MSGRPSAMRSSCPGCPGCRRAADQGVLVLGVPVPPRRRRAIRGHARRLSPECLGGVRLRLVLRILLPRHVRTSQNIVDAAWRPARATLPPSPARQGEPASRIRSGSQGSTGGKRRHSRGRGDGHPQQPHPATRHASSKAPRTSTTPSKTSGSVIGRWAQSAGRSSQLMSASMPAPGDSRPGPSTRLS